MNLQTTRYPICQLPLWFACSLAFMLGNVVSGQTVLYDNTHVPVFDGRDWGIFPDDPFTFGAQSFRVGNSGAISEITIGMSRATNGSGTVSFSLWDDDDGIPGTSVAEIGTVDVALLEDSRSVALPMVTFKPDIEGLVPNQLYYVVSDHTELSGNSPSRNNSIVYGAIRHNENTKSPPVLLGSFNAPEPSRDTWETPADLGFEDEWLQMRVVAAGDPFATPGINFQETYRQTFDSFPNDGSRTALPHGWVYYDEVVENDVADPGDDEMIYNTLTTHDFPPGARFRLDSAGATLFNAGVPGETDRALTVGTHRRSGESTIQFVTEVTGGNAESLQLAFDMEVWESDRSRDDPGEAAFDVALDLDTGNGFEPLLDLGRVTTGATLVPAMGDFVDGNDDAYRVSFDSRQRNLAIPDGAQLRISWKADLEAETRGWVFGLDNVSLRLFADAISVLGDFDGNGQLTAGDIDLLSEAIRDGEDALSFDVNSDDVIDFADREHWVTSREIANTLFGDANLDGIVDFADFLALSKGFGSEGGWGQGDFDGNGDVEFPDFLALAESFGQSASVAAVPEPSSFLLHLIGLAGFAKRRSRSTGAFL